MFYVVKYFFVYYLRLIYPQYLDQYKYSYYIISFVDSINLYFNVLQ